MRFGHKFLSVLKQKGVSFSGLLHAANGNGTLGNPGMVAKKVKIKGTFMLHERLINEANLALFTGHCNGSNKLFISN
ncbi:MAG: hypothetical protein H6561_11685 [Lewinellaceae bacterium]|nr:hypothetical protein [Lewinellaceae bacterium]